jgi:hypothetical protein
MRKIEGNVQSGHKIPVAENRTSKLSTIFDIALQFSSYSPFLLPVGFCCVHS